MADPAGVALDVLAARQRGLQVAAVGLGLPGAAAVLLAGWMVAVVPELWKVPLGMAAVGLVFGGLALSLWRRAARRGPLLVLRADSIGLPQMAAGNAPAPTRLRWSEIESLVLTGPVDRPEALVLVLSAAASRARGVAVPGIPDDKPHLGTRIRLSLPLQGLSEKPDRIAGALARAAEGAGLIRRDDVQGVAQRFLDGTLGAARRWTWPRG